MGPNLTISVVDQDTDCLTIEIHATNGRFAGSARVYAGLRELSEIADQIAGFPRTPNDERTCELGIRDPRTAGGYCHLRLYCLDQSGHANIEIAIDDYAIVYEQATAQLSFRVEAAAIDLFTVKLREVESSRTGEAILSSCQ